MKEESIDLQFLFRPFFFFLSASSSPSSSNRETFAFSSSSSSLSLSFFFNHLFISFFFLIYTTSMTSARVSYPLHPHRGRRMARNPQNAEENPNSSNANVFLQH